MTESGNQSSPIRGLLSPPQKSSSSHSIPMSPTLPPRSDCDGKPEPALSEITKGLALFATSIGLYSIYALLIKIMLQQFALSVPELTYYVSLTMVVLLAISAKFY